MFMQERHNSIANALELRLSFTNISTSCSCRRPHTGNVCCSQSCVCPLVTPHCCCCKISWCHAQRRMPLVHWLTHWGRVMHICVSKLTRIGSAIGLLPVWGQAIIWTNAGILLIGPSRTNFSEIFIKIHTFSFTIMHFKMSSRKWRPFCLGLNALRNPSICWISVNG